MSEGRTGVVRGLRGRRKGKEWKRETDDRGPTGVNGPVTKEPTCGGIRAEVPLLVLFSGQGPGPPRVRTVGWTRRSSTPRCRTFHCVRDSVSLSFSGGVGVWGQKGRERKREGETDRVPYPVFVTTGRPMPTTPGTPDSNVETGYPWQIGEEGGGTSVPVRRGLSL